jgi:hypothetical protein
MLIDAKNERVAGWYASYGVVELLDAPLILLLPRRIIADALTGRVRDRQGTGQGVRLSS